MNDRTAQPVLQDSATLDASVVDRVAERAHEAIDSVAAKVKPTVDRVQFKAEALRALENQWLDGARDRVREQPLTAVAVGLLAGLLLSRLTS